MLALNQSVKDHSPLRISSITAVCHWIQDLHVSYKSPHWIQRSRPPRVVSIINTPRSPPATIAEYLLKRLIVSEAAADRSGKLQRRKKNSLRGSVGFHGLSVLTISEGCFRKCVYTHLMYFSSFPNCNGTEQKFTVWAPSELITITIHNWEANAWKIALHHISFWWQSISEQRVALFVS